MKVGYSYINFLSLLLPSSKGSLPFAIKSMCQDPKAHNILVDILLCVPSNLKVKSKNFLSTWTVALHCSDLTGNEKKMYMNAETNNIKIVHFLDTFQEFRRILPNQAFAFSLRNSKNPVAIFRRIRIDHLCSRLPSFGHFLVF